MKQLNRDEIIKQILRGMDKIDKKNSEISAESAKIRDLIAKLTSSEVTASISASLPSRYNDVRSGFIYATEDRPGRYVVAPGVDLEKPRWIADSKEEFRNKYWTPVALIAMQTKEHKMQRKIFKIEREENSY